MVLSVQGSPKWNGVAVFGKNTWAVLQAKKIVASGTSGAEIRSTEQLVSEHKKLLEQPTYEVNKQYSTSEATKDIMKAET